MKPKAEDVRQQGPEAQRLTQLWNRLVLEEGVLKRKYDDTTSGCTIVQLVVDQNDSHQGKSVAETQQDPVSP